MSKHEKYIFQELPKNAVVNLNNNEMDYHHDDIINLAVTQHLQTIIAGEPNELLENITTEEESTENIEQIKLDNYNKGLDDAKAKYEPMMSEIQSNQDFALLLEQKISEVNPSLNLDTEIAKLAVDIIGNIARKIYLVLPVDFEKILQFELLENLKKFYKEGTIKLTVNPARYDFCLNILQLDKLPAKFMDNLEIVQDSNCGSNDCKIEWQDTCLEYSQDQLSEEIEKILEQLRKAT